MFAYSIKVLEEQLDILLNDYHLVCEHSGFFAKEPENAEPDIIDAIQLIKTRMRNLTEAKEVLETTTKYYVKILEELA